MGDVRIEGRAVGGDHLALNEVLGRLADEGIAVMIHAEKASAINEAAAGRGKSAGVRRAHEAWHEAGGGGVRAGGPDLARVTVGRGILHGVAEGEIGIALEVTGAEHDVLEWIAVRANEFSAEIIKGETELARARNGFKFTGVGIEARVASL